MQNRISDSTALELFTGASLAQIGQAATASLGVFHDQHIRTYIIDRNINYTDICTCRCKFCAFCKPSAAKGGYVLDYDKLYNKVVELRAIGGNQILMQGGLNNQLDLKWHCKVLSDLKRDFPGLHIHAYSPPEILFFARTSGKPVKEVTAMLCSAGLDTIPGGGAEILVDSVRKQVSPAKCSSGEWLEVMRIAHSIGVYTTATMMLGHLETPAQRIEHLEKVRRLQDESLSRGKAHFTSFTAWPFQPGNSALSKHPDLHLADSIEYLRTIAMARVYLDNIKNIQSSWVTMGPDVGQLSLMYGCNDLGSVMMEEKVVAAAGTCYSLNEQQVRDIISSAGFEPRRRNFFYQHQQQ